MCPWFQLEDWRKRFFHRRHIMVHWKTRHISYTVQNLVSNRRVAIMPTLLSLAATGDSSSSRKFCQGDSPCFHWKRLRHAPTSPVNTGTVTLTAFPFLWTTKLAPPQLFGSNDTVQPKKYAHTQFALCRVLLRFGDVQGLFCVWTVLPIAYPLRLLYWFPGNRTARSQWSNPEEYE